MMWTSRVGDGSVPSRRNVDAPLRMCILSFLRTMVRSAVALARLRTHCSGPFGACSDLEHPVRDGPSSFGWLATGTAGPLSPSCPGHGRGSTSTNSSMASARALRGRRSGGSTRTIISSCSSMTCQTPEEEKFESQVRGLPSESAWLEHRKTKRIAWERVCVCVCVCVIFAISQV